MFSPAASALWLTVSANRTASWETAQPHETPQANFVTANTGAGGMAEQEFGKCGAPIAINRAHVP